MGKITQRKENEYLYAVKGIASVLVIFIHFPLPGLIGGILDALGRLAVPIFFIISGRYLAVPENETDKGEVSACRRKNLHRAWKLFKLTAGVTAVYAFFSFCSLAIAGSYSVVDWIWMKCNRHEVLQFLLFNSGKVIYDELYYIDHLWYLFAMIYVLLIVCMFMGHDGKWTGILMICPLLFTVVASYGGTLANMESFCIFGEQFEARVLTRNYLFTALPFVGFGMLLQQVEKRGRCRAMFSKKAVRLALLSLAVFGAGWSIIERVRGGESRDLFLGTILAAMAITTLSLCYEKCHVSGLVFLGKRLSGSIYYWHPLLAILVFGIILKGRLGQYSPLALAVLSVLVSFVCYLGRKKMRKEDKRAIMLMAAAVAACFLFCVGFWQYGMRVRKDSLKDVEVLKSSENVLFFVKEICYNQKGDALIYAWSKNGNIHYPFHNWVLGDSDEEYKIAEIVLTDGEDVMYVLKTYPYEMGTEGDKTRWVLDPRDGCVAYVTKEYCQRDDLSIAVVFSDREGNRYIVYQDKEYEKNL